MKITVNRQANGQLAYMLHEQGRQRTVHFLEVIRLARSLQFNIDELHRRGMWEQPGIRQVPT